VTYQGQQYLQFLLDINEGGNANLARLSLDKVEIYLGAAGDLHNYPTGLGTKVYDMDGPPDNNSRVELNYRLNSGSGSGDMFLDVPIANFALSGALPYVYLYSHFGTPNSSDAGFEEWATLQGQNPPVDAPPPETPLPATAWAGGGLLVMMAAGRRRKSSMPALA
jgi:hypothetical protein